MKREDFFAIFSGVSGTQFVELPASVYRSLDTQYNNAVPLSDIYALACLFCTGPAEARFTWLLKTLSSPAGSAGVASDGLTDRQLMLVAAVGGVPWGLCAAPRLRSAQCSQSLSSQCSPIMSRVVGGFVCTVQVASDQPPSVGC